MNNKKIIITGGCGFAGHHFVEHFLKETDWDIAVLDKLTYAANGFDRVRDINVFDNKRVTFYTVDLSEEISEGILKELKESSILLHLAGETHVDRSIIDPILFVKANVLGTCNMLNFARKLDNLEAMLFMSTDEVFGPAYNVEKAYKEWDRYNSGNPYSASKAGAEEMCLAFANTYGVPVFITHGMNMFGERQHPEKFIPLCIRNILQGDKITVHADKTKTVSGVRSYIHCRNVANGVHFLLNNFEVGQKYNIVGEAEMSNLEMAKLVADILGKTLNYEMVDFHSSRPGHDLRYALDGTLMKIIGWKPPMTITRSIETTIQWYLKNPKWLEFTT